MDDVVRGQPSCGAAAASKFRYTISSASSHVTHVSAHRPSDCGNVITGERFAVHSGSILASAVSLVDARYTESSSSVKGFES